MSGGVAAVGSSVVKVPIAVCIRSVQAGVYPNVFAAAREITRAAGPGGLYCGWCAAAGPHGEEGGEGGGRVGTPAPGGLVQAAGTGPP